MKKLSLFSLLQTSFIICFAVVVSKNSFAHLNNSRVDGHAPIGVMRDHMHNKGELMLSYRFSYMKMQDLNQGSDKISKQEVLQNFMATPLKMHMKMHMFGAMYGISDKFTIAAMASAMSKEMQMKNRMNQISENEVSGFGDSKIHGFFRIFTNQNHHAQFNFGLSVPTGSIKETSANNSRLPYKMQLGSGSFELLPGITYSGFQESFSYGAQANATFRLDTNNLGYKLGDIYNFTSWIAKKLNPSFSTSARLNYTISEAIEGRDKALNAMMAPPANASFSAYKNLDLLFGINFMAQNGIFKGHRLAIEAGKPLYQKVKGIQMVNHYQLTAGWQKTF
jgi:hypothetical protein